MINNVGIVNIIPVLKYVPQEIFTPLPESTCSHSSVASDPIGVIFGPRSEPMTLAYIKASLMIPEVCVASIASASIMTVGRLFITDEMTAAIKPIPIVAANTPDPQQPESNPLVYPLTRHSAIHTQQHTSRQKRTRSPKVRP